MEQRRSEWIAAHGPCALCGSSVDLQVDHVDPAGKAVSATEVWSLAADNPRRVDELAKCQVLCATCHLAKTAAYRRSQMVHGKVMYRIEGCRCEVCRAAESAYRKGLRLRNSRRATM